MKKIRCAIYDRVSTEEQALFGLSLAAQAEDLTRYANEHGYEIVGYYADEGITARKKMENRKEFVRLLEDVKKDKIDLVLVTKLDRWFRNVRDYHNTQAILEEHHCNWRTIYEDYDTSTADGQLKINIMLAVAQNECDRTSERIKIVLAHKKRNGEHVTGAAPYGYITVQKKLQKDPKREHIVNDIFKYYFSCFSKKETVSYILCKYNDDKLTSWKINRILGNEAYCGRYQGISNYHPAYITEEEYDKIRKISAAKSYAHTNGAYLFSGILKCPVCGANMTGFIKKQKLKDGTRSLYKRYRCQRKFSDHPNGPCITEHIVEDYMIEHLWPELQHSIYKASHQSSSQVVDKSPQIHAEINRLNILFQKGRISEDYYDSQYSILEQKLQEETEKHKSDILEAYRNIEEFLTVDWLDMYKELDIDHKKAFWKRIIKQITFDKETNKINGFSFLI